MAAPPARGISFWHDQLNPRPRTRARLDGDREADVAIVGAGFTGLWTAYELLRRDSELSVAVLEANVVGFGASGRNGGWVEGLLAGDRGQRARSGGQQGARRLEREIRATVDEVGKVVATEAIDCGFTKGGTLAVAQTDLEARRLADQVDDDRLWGLGPDDSRLLSAEEASSRIAVDGVRAAYFSPHCARVQPAALATGLADAVERAGGRIYEHSPVLRIDPRAAHTAAGTVTARYIVRATEAYTASLHGHRRTILPITSAIIITEPLGAEQWAALRWDNAETLRDGRRRYIYAQRTADGRIAIGGRGVPYRFGSRYDADANPTQQTARALRARLVELFPVLHDVRIDGAWRGVLGASRQWAPMVGVDRSTGLAWAGGYVGEGVAAANLASRTLADLLTDQHSDLTMLPWVGGVGPKWPPEPIRFIGVRGVNKLAKIADEVEEDAAHSSLAWRLAHAISGL